MRILHVTRDFPPIHKGGISTAVGGLVRAFHRAGVTVAVISFDGWRPKANPSTGADLPEPRDESGVYVLRVSAPNQLVALRRFVSNWEPDVVHVHDPLLWEAMEYTHRCPTVYTAHVVHAAQNAWRGVQEETLGLLAERRVMEAADRVVAPSHAAASLLEDAGYGLEDRLHVVAHALQDSPAAQNAANARRTNGGVLCAGRFGDVKGREDVEALVSYVGREHTETPMVVAGGVVDNPKVARRWARRFEEVVPAGMNIDFPGWVPPENLSALYAEAQVLVVPSHLETFGLVALEGMLHGTAVLAYGCGALAELIQNGETGVYVPVGDREALQSALTALLDDPSECRRLGQNAARFARANFLWEHRLKDALAVYME